MSNAQINLTPNTFGVGGTTNTMVPKANFIAHKRATWVKKTKMTYLKLA